MLQQRTEAAPPKKRTLLDITGDLAALDELIYEELEGDISDPQVAQIVDEFLAELDADLKGKVDNYAAYITELLGRAEIRKREADRMAKRAKIDDELAFWLKIRLRGALESRRIKKLETARYRVSVANNGGKQPIDLHDPQAIPRALCRHVPEEWKPDLDQIRAKLAAGEEVPGAILMERGTHLRIV